MASVFGSASKYSTTGVKPQTARLPRPTTAEKPTPSSAPWNATVWATPPLWATTATSPSKTSAIGEANER